MVRNRVLGLSDTPQPKTKSSWRTLVLPGPLVEVLRTHRTARKAERLAAGPLWVDSGLVFTTAIGTPTDPDNLRRAFGGITVGAGLGRRHPHGLRHAAATMLLAQGVPLEVVSETLGHSGVRVTKDVYGHLVIDQRRAAADAAERALWGESAQS